VIPALDRLERLIADALARVDMKEYPTLVAVLADRMPAVAEALADMAVSDEVSQSTRLRASTLLYSIFSRCTKSSDKADEAEVAKEEAIARRESAKARRARANLGVEELKAAELKKRIAHGKKVAKLLSGAEQKETQNG
jgi:hypothetical protein